MLQCRIARFRAANLPLRPLLYAAGAAGTAAGVYYYIKKRRDGERTAEPVEKTVCADSAVVESDLRSDVDALRVTQTDRAVAEECERKQDAHSILKSQSDKMKETITDFERERVTHVILESQYEGSLKVCLTKAEEKYELALEYCVQLEKEKSELMSDGNALQGLVQELKKELSVMQMRHDELATECKQKRLQLRVLQTKHDVMRTFLQKKYEEKLLARSKMKSQYDQTKEALTEKDVKETLTHTSHVSLAEAEEQYQTSVHMNNNRIRHIKELIMEAYKQQKHEQISLVTVLMGSCAQVESELMSLMKPLRASVQQQEKEIHEIHRMYCKIMKEQEEECESHRLLKLQYTEIMKTLKQCYELLKNCLGSEEPEPQI